MADFGQQFRGHVTIHFLLQIEGQTGGGAAPHPCICGIHGCCSCGCITGTGGGLSTLEGSSLEMLNVPHTVAVPQPPPVPPGGGGGTPFGGLFPLRGEKGGCCCPNCCCPNGC